VSWARVVILAHGVQGARVVEVGWWLNNYILIRGRKMLNDWFIAKKINGSGIANNAEIDQGR